VDKADVVIVAGEVSGDERGAELARARVKQRPELKIAGVAGEQMRAAKVAELFPMEKLQVMGFIDVVKAAPKLIAAFNLVKRQILETDPKAVVFVDYPGFNLRMARALKKHGAAAKRIHYVAPSVWAWGKKRVEFMAEHHDHLMTLFPFEKRYFAHTKLPVTHVGHPLAHFTERPLPKSDKLEALKKPLIAIFPGSRRKEIQRNLPLALKAASLFDASIAISCAKKELYTLIRQLAPKISIATSKDMLIASADVAIATSGTVTLELGLKKIPTVVIYSITKIDEFLAQKVFRISIPYYSLCNILCGEEIFPELFGSALNLSSLSTCLREILSSKKTYQNRCQKVIDSLGLPPTSEQLAEPILKLL